MSENTNQAAKAFVQHGTTISAIPLNNFEEMLKTMGEDEPYGVIGDRLAETIDYTDLSKVNSQIKEMLPIIKERFPQSLDYFFKRSFKKFFDEYNQNDEDLIQTYLFERKYIMEVSGSSYVCEGVDEGTLTDRFLRDRIANREHQCFAAALEVNSGRLIAAMLHIPQQNWVRISTLPDLDNAKSRMKTIDLTL